MLPRFFAWIKSIWKRFLKFGLVGAAGTLIEIGIVFGLNTLLGEKAAEFLIWNIIQLTGYEITVMTNYLMSFFWVWRDRKVSFWPGFLKYNLSTVAAYICRALIFNLGMFLSGAATDRNMVVYYIFYFISVGIPMVINFLLIHYKVFNKSNN